MLVAVDSHGTRRVASPSRREGDYTCPDCKQPVVMRVGERRLPHFAHRAGKKCAEARAAERRRRSEVRRNLKNADQVEGQQELEI